MTDTLYYVAKALVLPPVSLIWLGLAGLALWRRRPRAARWCVGIALGLMYVLSTPMFAGLAHGLMQPAWADPLARPEAQAIVVLGGGIDRYAPEFGPGETAGYLTLARCRYAAVLHRRTGRPILAAGGSVTGKTTPESHLMRAVLADELGVPVRWIEDRSRDTFGNAFESRAILAREGVDTIYLVTHAIHIPRARRVFERAGFTVIPAPTGIADPSPTDPLMWLPTARGLFDTAYFFHEAIGYVWYMLRSPP